MPHRTLCARYGVNRINPILEVDDGVPGATYCSTTPGLNHCRVFTPCLSLITGRRMIERGTRSGPLPIPLRTVSTAWAAVTVEFVPAKYTHSPELPQFSTVQLESVPWTVLERNQTHYAPTLPRPVGSSTGTILLSSRIHPSCADCALSNLSHYQTD